MKFSTIEENFEYRMERVLSSVLHDLGKNAAQMAPDELDKTLWDNAELLGQRVYESMFEWMSEEDWIKLLKGE